MCDPREFMVFMYQMKAERPWKALESQVPRRLGNTTLEELEKRLKYCILALQKLIQLVYVSSHFHVVGMPQANHIRIKCGLIPNPCPHPMDSRYILSLQIQGTYKGFFMSKMYPAFVSSAWESFFWSKVTRWIRLTTSNTFKKPCK